MTETLDYAELARLARNKSARWYRAARKAERDARQWDKLADSALSHAAWMAAHTQDGEHPFAAMADSQREQAAQCRLMAEQERHSAPGLRRLGAEQALAARNYQARQEARSNGQD